MPHRVDRWRDMVLAVLLQQVAAHVCVPTAGARLGVVAVLVVVVFGFVAVFGLVVMFFSRDDQRAVATGGVREVRTQ